MSELYVTDISPEPPAKKMKFEKELELYQFQIGYLTKKGYILLENKKILGENFNCNNLDEDSEYDNYIILLDRHNRPFEMYILQFQSCEGVDCYLVADKSQIDINKGYTIKLKPKVGGKKVTKKNK